MKNNLSRLLSRFPVFILIAVLLCIPVSSCHIPVRISPRSAAATQKKFEQYTRDLFVSQIRGNTLNLHYTLSDPAAFGITDYPVTLGNMSENEQEKEHASLENIRSAIRRFSPDALTPAQQLTRDVLLDYCDRELSVADLYYYEEPLRPTTGIHAELPILLAEYAFYQKSDITDYLLLLPCVEDALSDIVAFEKQKADMGLFMPESAADSVIEMCDHFTENPEKHYLITTFHNRLASLTFVSEQEKAAFEETNRTQILTHVIPAYQSLKEAMLSLKKSSKNSAGLCYLPDGKRYYTCLAGKSSCSSRDIPALQKLTETQRASDIRAVKELLAKNSSLSTADADTLLPVSSPDAMLALVQKNMKQDFAPPANTSYELHEIDPSLEASMAPAFYLTAPVDRIDHNVIYLNKSSAYEGIQLFTTLAHEGFPGHLYQTTGSWQAGLSPIRSILSHPGYTEGWATYVEMCSYSYAGLPQDLASLLMHHQSALLSLYASIDMGIHYDGWTLADTACFLQKYGIGNISAAKNIFALVVSEPAHYLKYYIGYLEFLELKKEAEETMQDSYSNIRFHSAVIEMGPAPFDLLRKYLSVFMNPKEAADTRHAY